MKRTLVAAHAVALLLSLSASLAVTALIVLSGRQQGFGAVLPPLLLAAVGAGLGYVLNRRRARQRPPHRLVVRRGIWMFVAPAIACAAVVVPSVVLWIVAALAGLGTATAILMTHRIAGKTTLGAALFGLVCGLLMAFVMSRSDLRGTVDDIARANGLTANQLERLPQTISISDAAGLAEDPRTGALAGSLREARQATLASQFTGSFRVATIAAFVSLLISLFLPRKLRQKEVR